MSGGGIEQRRFRRESAFGPKKNPRFPAEAFARERLTHNGDAVFPHASQHRGDTISRSSTHSLDCYFGYLRKGEFRSKLPERLGDRCGHANFLASLNRLRVPIFSVNSVFMICRP